MQVGDRLDMKTIFLLTGFGKEYLSEVEEKCSPNFIAKDLLHAAREVTSI